MALFYAQQRVPRAAKAIEAENAAGAPSHAQNGCLKQR